MTQAEKDAAIDTLDQASLAAANAFQTAQRDTEAGVLNPHKIAMLNAFGAAMDTIRAIPTTEAE